MGPLADQVEQRVTTAGHEVMRLRSTRVYRRWGSGILRLVSLINMALRQVVVSQMGLPDERLNLNAVATAGENRSRLYRYIYPARRLFNIARHMIAA